MDARGEQVRRLALKRRRKLGSLSEEAYAELELAVRRDPERFVDDEEEVAFALVVRALAVLERAREDDDLLEDDAFEREHGKRLERLARACTEALSHDPSCTDAALLQAIASTSDLDARLTSLIELNDRLMAEHGSIVAGATGDAWADVFSRPRLRLEAQVAQTCLSTARYRMSASKCRDLLAKAPLDALGARLTLTLALARLEDEEAFLKLEAHGGSSAGAWSHLGRVILMYKLGRMPAARRALRGYDQLCQGGAYALLQPHFVDAYLPDRPSFVPGSFEEAMLAVHEADPIVSDVPDLCAWAQSQDFFLRSARNFCRREGLDWREW